MAKGKITIMSADQVSELKAKARGRAVFQEIIQNGQYRHQRHENKKRKAEKKRIQNEDRAIKRGDY